jgi:AraC-like DNA-binding protein
VRDDTASARHRLYLLARVLVARHYRQELTLSLVACALASSPRQLQRAYEQFGEMSFREDLLARRLSAAADLLLEQRHIRVVDVARLVGYSEGSGSHFANAFKRRYGLSPGRFREVAEERVREGRELERAAQEERAERGEPLATNSLRESSSPISTGSAPGKRRRINVPPPGAVSAAMVPPC